MVVVTASSHLGCVFTQQSYQLPPASHPLHAQASACALRCEEKRRQTLHRIESRSVVTPHDRYVATDDFEKCYRSCPGVRSGKSVDTNATSFATILGILLAGGAVAAGVILGFTYLYRNR